ncbi:MAG: saccharopine dehydrogenase C-terminal domain-containing protein [Candidatus Thorarchaeota archaeon]
MTIRCMVLGCGLMGRAVAYDLSRCEKVEHVVLGDIDVSRAESLARSLGPNVSAVRVDARKREQLIEMFSKVDAVASCVSYSVNLLHTEAAIEAGCHLTDLGGNLHVVMEQLKLSSEASDRGVTIIPDCGLAPGLTNVLASALIERLSDVSSVKIRVGGLPQRPRPPLNYSIVFSTEGLINEYVEPCMVLRSGKIAYEEPLTETERIVFPEPFGELEAFNTSGGSSTLPITYQGKVMSLDYKTIRYPGHADKMLCMKQLGLMDSTPHEFDGIRVAPRRVLERLLETNLPPFERDVTLLRVTVSGREGRHSRTYEYEMIDYYDDSTGLSSMMRTTAFPQSIVTVMTADGTIGKRGVIPPETAVEADSLISELARRNVKIVERTP